jgi:hypothetical protein
MAFLIFTQNAQNGRNHTDDSRSLLFLEYAESVFDAYSVN